MTDSEIKRIKADGAYKALCLALDNLNYTYDRTDNMGVIFGLRCDRCSLKFFVFIDEPRQLVRFLTPLPFDINKEKFIDAALGIQYINHNLTAGNFDLNIDDGSIYFRVANSFRGDTCFTSGFFEKMIMLVASTVDYYVLNIAALNNGSITLEEFANHVS